MITQKIKKKIIIDLEDEIPELAINDIQSFSLNQYKSKKNFVYDLVFEEKPKEFPKEVILKVFRTENFEKEFNAYQKLKSQNVPIPKILFYKNPYLMLEKVNGMNLCDVINDNLINKTRLNDLSSSILDLIILSMRKLSHWIALLHRKNIIKKNNFASEVIVLNKGDAHLRDFIINFNNETIYGLDFEESYEGNYLDDLSWICCSLLDTEPGIFEMFEPIHKVELINLFLKEYFLINNDFKFSFDYFADRLIEDLNIVIKRRYLDFAPINKQAILKSISKQY
jgi:tRNA A-37 threonylcarbamoyl transferase component Bud32